MKTVWLIDPHDPLIFRDGKPFSAIPGSTAQTLPFPLPSAITGSLRHLAGLDGQGSFIAGDPQATSPTPSLNDLKSIEAKGPFLVQLTTHQSDTFQWLAPAPGDALLFPFKASEEGETTNDQDSTTPDDYCQISQLVPRTFGDSCQTDLTNTLQLIGQKEGSPRTKDKPLNNAPRFWHWDQFIGWLTKPETYTNIRLETSKLGIAGPQNEARVHVAIDPYTRTGKDQALFSTVGLRFNHVPPAKSNLAPSQLSAAQHLGLAVIVEENQHTTLLQPRFSFTGAERRIVTWRRSRSEVPPCPPEIIAQIQEHHACRLILLTPAIFRKDSQPQRWLTQDHEGVTVTIKAVKVDRHQYVSGWDLEHKRPKPTRRIVPAGSVFFLSLEGEPQHIEAWVKRTWFNCISDTEQDCRDGFGVAVLGTHTNDQEEHSK